MFPLVRQHLASLLVRNEWAIQLAGILPLSALIDFIDTPPQLHIVQLTGAVPLWSWPITPAASRLLLAAQDDDGQSFCYLDHFGHSLALWGFDGRYGDRYVLSSPETTRLCVRASGSCTVVENGHENMMKSGDLRLQNLELVHVSHRPSSSSRRRCGIGRSGPIWSWRFSAASALGWIVWAALLVLCVVAGTFIALAFLALMPLTGGVIHLLHGGQPRKLLAPKESPFNRLVLVMDHENTTRWTVFYGESTLVNALLNRPLQSEQDRRRTRTVAETTAMVPTPILRMLLRVCILGQWALALAAACMQDWNAYFLCFWIVLCIFAHAYIIPPTGQVQHWMQTHAHLRLERYQTVLSSRRALLSCIVALNPDTFDLARGAQGPLAAQEDRTRFAPGAMRWIDGILHEGADRTRWEQATRQAMNAAAAQKTTFFEASPSLAGKGQGRVVVGQDWLDAFQKDYWHSGILEGIYVAAELEAAAHLSGRMVSNEKHMPL